MAFGNLKKQLGSSDPYTADLAVKDLDPSLSPNAFMRQALDKVGSQVGLGGDKQTADSIEPDYNNPIDMLVGGAASKLGGTMVRDAGTIVGNEAGSLGAQRFATGTKFNPSDASHVAAIRSDLMKRMPDDFSQGYTGGGELIAELMKDPSRQAELMKNPKVMEAIAEFDKHNNEVPKETIMEFLKKKLGGQ